jgi:hypothetical protein
MNFFRWPFLRAKSIDPADATASILRPLIGRCSVCGSTELAGHVYTELATAIVGDPSQNQQALELAEKGDWEELRRISSWDNLRDNLCWMAIRCDSGGLSVMTYVDRSELYDGGSVLVNRTIVESDELERLNRLFEAAIWQPLTAGTCS